MRQEGITCNVEGDAEAHIRTPLIHLAGQFILVRVDVELTKHVAGGEGHDVQIGRVPGGHDDAAVFGVVLDFVNAFRELVDALAGVVGVHVLVFGAEVAPLEAVDGAEVADVAVLEAAAVEEFSGSVAVPDVNVFGGQFVGVCASLCVCLDLDGVVLESLTLRRQCVT